MPWWPVPPTVWKCDLRLALHRLLLSGAFPSFTSWPLLQLDDVFDHMVPFADDPCMLEPFRHFPAQPLKQAEGGQLTCNDLRGAREVRLILAAL